MAVAQVMTLPMISVIIPTVEGREDHLARGIAAYQMHADGQYDLELVVEHDRATCGLGWQLGADRATGDYLHFTCDDIEPKPGWAAPAIEAIEAGFIPAPQVYGADGTPQSHPVWGQISPDWSPVYMTSLPFVSREQYEQVVPLLTCHYFCVVPDTPVLTAEMEWVPAGKLALGDELVGFDEVPEPGRAHCRRYRRSSVLGNDLRRMECLTVRFTDGREVTCSLQHAWLTKGYRSDLVGTQNAYGLGWVTASRLRVGDRILAPLRVWRTETSFEAGWLSGIFDGEGSAGRYSGGRAGVVNTHVSVAQNPGPVLDRMRAGLDSLGIRYREYGTGTGQVVRLHIATLGDGLEMLGRLRPTRLQTAGLWEGAAMRGRPSVYAEVESVESVGMREVVALGTSTGTFMANGLASHNTDDWFSFRCERAGWATRLRIGYAFTHHWAQHKRGAGMSEWDRMGHDEPLYQQARRMVEAGNWTEPWPLPRP